MEIALKRLDFNGATWLAATSILALSPIAPALAAAPPASTIKPASVASLVAKVSIPHSSFTLANGLRVIVHEDHKAPMVGVAVYYNVGSRDEPKGRSGFAHLFEHVMFNGTENMPGDYFNYLQQIGATDYNGQTTTDWTRYFETVPTGALERTLFMEADRMGYLLGAITDDVLENQRAVVQNEKRQADSAPGGLIQYALFENLFPLSHPYHHPAIGSMEDLDAANLGDVKQWFRDRYGPNNAVLVVAGDLTAAQIRPLAQKYFGAIKRGPINRPAQAGVPTLTAPKQVNLKDQVAFTIQQRYWAVSGSNEKDFASLQIGAAILGGLASSRLDEALVRNEKIAVNASASVTSRQRASVMAISTTAKPGTDPALVSRRVDEIVADFIAKGPTAEEVQRAVVSVVGNVIRQFESVGGFTGKSVTLAEDYTVAGNSNAYKRDLAAFAAVTPASVRQAMQKWLRRPALTITLSPGQRENYVEAKSRPATPQKPKPAVANKAPALTPPPIGQMSELQWPEVSHRKLSNGIPITYIQRKALPLTQVSIVFDAGDAADPVDQRGLSGLTTALLDEGTEHFTGQQVAETKEKLGAQISAFAYADQTQVLLSALSPNLEPSLDLASEVARRPAFAPADIERIRGQVLAGLAQLLKTPQQVGARVMPAALFGANHPYGGGVGGDAAFVTKMSRDDLVGFQQRWLRPDNVKLFVVSDLPLAKIEAALESRFGNWQAPAVAKGVKDFSVKPHRATQEKILLINRPGSPQSTILASQVVPLDPRGNVSPFVAANQVLGGHFSSRINMDLRETKGWSYATFGNPSILSQVVTYDISAPVQADKTAAAITAIKADVTDFLTTKGVTPDERERTVANLVNGLPGEFETSGALLQTMIRMDLLGRPDNYYETLAGKYRAQTTASLDDAARATLDANKFTWVVVGDAAKIRPDLDKLGIPIEVVEPN